MVAGAGSIGSATGHFAKDTLKGTVAENPASNLESAGDGLTSWAHGAILTFIGGLVICGLVIVAARSKH